MMYKLYSMALAPVAILIWLHDASAEAKHSAGLLPPVSPACISSAFGPRVLPNQPRAGSYHYGVDLPAPAGASVQAIAPGTVIRIQNKGPGGLEMLVQHEGFVGIYSHFGTVMPAFAEGKHTVVAGEQLGKVGSTGVTTGTHLYFEMVSAGKPIDPAPYLGLPPCNGDAHRTLPDRRGADGPDLHTGRYYLLLPVSEPYRWPRH
jgi:murein DD-endopeptidase MepM/ murein hydrolase activator NlpD